jgi:hypothetical protein
MDVGRAGGNAGGEAGENTNQVNWLSTFDFESVEAALVVLAMPICESKWQPPTGDGIQVSRGRLGSILSRLCSSSVLEDLELLWPANNFEEALVSTTRGTYLLSGSPTMDVLSDVKAWKKKRKKRKSKTRMHPSTNLGDSLGDTPHHRHRLADDVHDPELGKVAVVAVTAAWRSCCCALSCCLPEGEKRHGVKKDDDAMFPKSIHDLSECPLCSRQYENVIVS